MEIFIMLLTKVILRFYFQGSEICHILKLYLDMQRTKDEMLTHLNDFFYFPFLMWTGHRQPESHMI